MIPGVGIPMFMGASGLYQFTTFTFTNCSITGQNGPTLAQMQSAYSATAWTQNTAFFNIGAYQGYQKWTVPKTGTYRFDIAGASGGKNTYADPNDYRGLGARVQADISLVEGEFIIIAVGQSGIIQTYSGGGGGATFIVRLSTPAALLVAGGGGGSYLNSDYRVSHSNASTATSGKTPSGNQTPGGGSGGGGYLGSGANSTSYGSGGGGFNVVSEVEVEENGTSMAHQEVGVDIQGDVMAQEDMVDMQVLTLMEVVDHIT